MITVTTNIACSLLRLSSSLFKLPKIVAPFLIGLPKIFSNCCGADIIDPLFMDYIVLNIRLFRLLWDIVERSHDVIISWVKVRIGQWIDWGRYTVVFLQSTAKTKRFAFFQREWKNPIQ